MGDQNRGPRPCQPLCGGDSIGDKLGVHAGEGLVQQQRLCITAEQCPQQRSAPFLPAGEPALQAVPAPHRQSRVCAAPALPPAASAHGRSALDWQQQSAAGRGGPPERRAAGLSTPVTVPESGASSPIRMRSSVVFPQPERPISTAGPSTAHVKSCRTGVSPKRLQRFRITMLMPVPPRRGTFLPCAAAGLPPQTVPPTAARSPASMRTRPAWIA